MVKYMMIGWMVLMNLSGKLFCQSTSFPAGWRGDWKGELSWYKTDNKDPVKIMMELRIRPIDSARSFTWQIIYGDSAIDNRPYTLEPVNPERGHWKIDENNGIILDQYWIGGKFCGAFMVGSSTIFNSYWMEGGQMMVEFNTISAKPLNTTGKGTEESPSVNSYSVRSYQKAILTRQ